MFISITILTKRNLKNYCLVNKVKYRLIEISDGSILMSKNNTYKLLKR